MTDAIKAAAQNDPAKAYKAVGYPNNLIASGRVLRGICCFHEEHKPSFTVFPDGRFYCFGCGAAGSIIDFFLKMRRETHLTKGAVDEMAQALGIANTSGQVCAGRGSGNETHYSIVDAHDKEIAVHVRIDLPNGGKRFIWRRNGKDNLGGIRTAQLPLYGLPELLAAEPASTVVVSEGEGATDALRAFDVLAVGTVTGAHSVPDQSTLQCLLGHDVVLWPDADQPGREHMRRIAQTLVGLGTVPRVIDWPEAEAHDDAADFTGDQGELLQLLHDAAAYSPDAHEERRARHCTPPHAAKLPTDMIAETVLERNSFAQDGGDALYQYEGGRYVPAGSSAINRCVKEVLADWGRLDQWSTHKCREVRQFIQADLPRLWDRPPLHTLNVRNGLLDVTECVLRPHTPEWLSQVQLPIEYRSEADCPEWRQFVATTLPSDCGDLVWQIAAWLMLPITSIQKAVLLVGEGSNGKSTLLEAIQEFLGRENCSAIALQSLETNRFAASQLVWKLANVCADIPSTKLCQTAEFKAITGGDRIAVERKNQPIFEVTLFCRLIFSSNHFPRSADTSEAFFRRWIIVPFHNTFENHPERTQCLKAQLADPDELSGVLNAALRALPTVLEKGIGETGSMQEARDEFRTSVDPIQAWIAEEVVLDPTAVTPKEHLRRSCNQCCSRAGVREFSPTAFGRAIRKAMPHLVDAQLTVDGRVQRCWVGIGLRLGQRDSAQQLSHHSQVAQ